MYDIGIIGGGTAGMTAAIYGQRAGKRTIIIEGGTFGGQITSSPNVENYPGIASVSGSEFSMNLLDQAMKLGAETQMAQVTGIRDEGEVKVIVTPEKEYPCRSIVLATGVTHRHLGVPNEERLTGAGVSYCATCDGMFFRGKEVAVVGGGNVAMDCARSAIRCHAKEVTVIYRRRQIDMTALPSEIQGAIEEGVELLTLNAPVKINADAEGNVCGFVAQPQIISVYDKQGKPSVTVANKPEIEVPCEVVLMAIGQDIVSAPFAEYDVNPRRKTFETLDTTRLKSYDKIFSGGDCVFGPATVIKAIGAGKVAALNIDEYLGYHHKYLEDIKIPEPRENDRTHYGRVHLTDRSARERKNNFEPVENGMSYDEAMQECGKCLRCDHFGCGVVEGGRV